MSFKERKNLLKKWKTHSRFVDGGRESSSTTLLLLPTRFCCCCCCWVVVIMPPPPAAKAPSFVLSARTVIVPLSLFNFGVEREADFKNLNSLLSFGENFSLCVFKKRAGLDSRSLSLTELFLFLSSGDWERAERAFSSSSFVESAFFARVRRKMKFSLVRLFFSRFRAGGCQAESLNPNSFILDQQKRRKKEEESAHESRHCCFLFS